MKFLKKILLSMLIACFILLPTQAATNTPKTILQVLGGTTAFGTLASLYCAKKAYNEFCAKNNLPPTTKGYLYFIKDLALSFNDNKTQKTVFKDNPKLAWLLWGTKVLIGTTVVCFVRDIELTKGEQYKKEQSRLQAQLNLTSAILSKNTQRIDDALLAGAHVTEEIITNLCQLAGLQDYKASETLRHLVRNGAKIPTTLKENETVQRARESSRLDCLLLLLGRVINIGNEGYNDNTVEWQGWEHTKKTTLINIPYNILVITCEYLGYQTKLSGERIAIPRRIKGETKYFINDVELDECDLDENSEESMRKMSMTKLKTLFLRIISSNKKLRERALKIIKERDPFA